MDQLRSQGKLEPQQHELLMTLHQANAKLPADQRQVIRGVRADGVLNLFHPGFSSRKFVPNDFDLQELNTLGLIRAYDKGGRKGWEVEVLPAGKQYLASVEGTDRPTAMLDNAQNQSVSNAYLARIATVLKDDFTLANINRFFELADADPDWRVEPRTEFKQERIRLALSWFQGITQHAPQELLRITHSVVRQALGGPQLSDQGRRDLETVRVRLDELMNEEARSLATETRKEEHSTGITTIFVAHGQDPRWGQFILALRDRWDVKFEYFEESNRTAQQISDVVVQMTSGSSLAVILMTGDDVMEDGTPRARQNVIHEAGLCHGVLGFDKVALLIQDGVEKFSNAQGIVYIPYDPERVTSCFHELGEFFERFGIARTKRT